MKMEIGRQVEQELWGENAWQHREGDRKRESLRGKEERDMEEMQEGEREEVEIERVKEKEQEGVKTYMKPKNRLGEY